MPRFHGVTKNEAFPLARSRWRWIQFCHTIGCGEAGDVWQGQAASTLPALTPIDSAWQPTLSNLITMFDRRCYLGAFAVLALVLLRLAVGWHFFGEGAKKLEYNRHDGQLRLVFSARDFLAQAKGPLADLYQASAPDDHGWRKSLAVGQQNVPLTEAAAAERSRWASDYQRRRAEATKAGGEVPIEFPPSAPYHDWAARISDDWRATLASVKAVSGLADEQLKRGESVLAARQEQLADYLAIETEAITEYQHELWRLTNWQSAPEAKAVPFYEQRIATKAAETASKPTAWVHQVRELEAEYHGELRGILTTEQRTDAAIAAALDEALRDPRQKWLDGVNVAVTALTVGVGACLLLGFFTRLASLAGALFLLAVIASQPPWLADAAPTMPQVIEFAALLVLAGTGAGRWAGLDFFTYALFNKRRAGNVEP